MMKQLLYLFLFSALANYTFAQNQRYTQTIFPSSTVTADVIYDTAPFINFPYHNENSTSVEDLVMDVYEPTGDIHNQRAAIIFVHSGGFAIGNRNHDDMVAFCDSFARKGYVTATIDYRKGFYVISNTAMHSTRAAYRGLQDGRSAVRHLRANAAAYGIDPNQVYLAGSSAGGFVALHSIYMTSPSEKPVDAGAVTYTNAIFPFVHSGPDLGGYDRGSNLGVSGTPNGIVSLWGAVVDLALIDPSDNEPVFMAHGTADATVPFDSGSPFGVPAFPTVFGSNLINNALAGNGMTNKETYFETGEPHEFYGTSNGTWIGSGGNMFWEILLPKIANFLWLQHKPDASFTFNPNGRTVDFTDSSNGAISWFWDFGDGNTSIQRHPTHTYAADGTYEVNLFVQNYLLSWDEVSIPVDVLAPLPLSWTSPLQARYEDGQAQLRWSVADQIDNERFVIEHSLDGQRFEAIGQLDAGINQVEEVTYRYSHFSPPAGLNYYRIQQVDFDGHSSYSTIAAVEVGDNASVFSFFPNPAKEQIVFQVSGDDPQWFDLYNVQGQLIRSWQVAIEKQLNISELSSGIYFVKQRKGEEIQRLIVQ